MRSSCVVVVAAIGILASACSSLTAPLDPENAAEHVDGDSVIALPSTATATEDTVAAPLDLSGVLEGIVLQAGSRAAIRNAKVTVPNTGLSTTTDASGRFRITGLTGGQDVVVIAHKNYSRQITPMLTLPVTGAVRMTVALKELPKPTPGPVGGGYRCGWVPVPLLIVDGTTVPSRAGLHDISAHKLASVEFLIGDEAVKRFGPQAASGVFVVETTGASVAGGLQ